MMLKQRPSLTYMKILTTQSSKAEKDENLFEGYF